MQESFQHNSSPIKKSTSYNANNKRNNSNNGNQNYEEYKKIYNNSHLLHLQIKQYRLKMIELIEKFKKICEIHQQIFVREQKQQKISVYQEQNKQKIIRCRRKAQEITRVHECKEQFCGKKYGANASLLQHIKIKHPQSFHKYI